MPRLQFHPLDHAAILAFVVYSASAVITPICLVILARELHFSLAEGGAIEAARGLLIVGALVISGFAAARWGKATSLGVSLLLLGGGMFLYAWAPSYALVVVAAGFLGIGGGVVEGLLNPLVQDLHPTDSGRYLNIVNGFWSVGVLSTVLVAGELLTREVSWRLILAGLGGLAVMCGLLFMWLARRSPHERAINTVDVMRQHWEILAHWRFWLFVPMMLLAGAAEGAFTFWSASYIQLHHDASPRAGGIGTAYFAGGMMLGRFAFGWWVAQRHLHWLIFLSACGGAVVGVVVPFVGSLGQLYAVLLAAGVTVACFWPSIQSYAVDRLPVDSTILFILLSCFGIPGFAAASWIMGAIGDVYSLRVSFYIVPAALAGLAALVLLERACKPGRRWDQAS